MLKRRLVGAFVICVLLVSSVPIFGQEDGPIEIYLPAELDSGSVSYDPVILEDLEPGDTFEVEVVLGFDGPAHGYQPMAWMSIPEEAALNLSVEEPGDFVFVDRYCYDDDCYYEYATPVLSASQFWLDPVVLRVTDEFEPGERVAVYFHNVVYDLDANTVANIVRGITTPDEEQPEPTPTEEPVEPTPVEEPEEEAALVTLDELFVLLGAGLLEEDDLIAVEGYVGFVEVFEDEEFVELLSGGWSDGDLNSPYYLFDDTIIETNLGFTHGTYLPFNVFDEDDEPVMLDIEENYGYSATVVGVLERTDTEEALGLANWKLRGRDISIYTGDDADHYMSRIPDSWLNPPGEDFPDEGTAPGRQLTADGEEIDCQYGIIIAGRQNTTILVNWSDGLQFIDRYLSDITFAAATLRGMGVPAANIEVAFASHTGLLLPGTDVSVTQPGSLAGIKAAVNNIVKRVQDDLDSGKTCNLYLIVTDHGGGLDLTETVASGTKLGNYVLSENAIPWPSKAGALLGGAAPGDEEKDNLDESDYAVRAVKLKPRGNVIVAPELNGDGVLGGVKINLDETIVATDGLYRDDKFAELFDDLPVPGKEFYFYVLMEQCFSGGFVRDMKVHVTHIATASSATQPSYAADTEGPYDEFLYHFLSALAGQDPYGTVVNADRDYLPDERVSWREAFYYALFHDNRNETPQFE